MIFWPGYLSQPSPRGLAYGDGRAAKGGNRCPSATNSAKAVRLRRLSLYLNDNIIVFQNICRVWPGHSLLGPRFVYSGAGA